MTLLVGKNNCWSWDRHISHGDGGLTARAVHAALARQGRGRSGNERDHSCRGPVPDFGAYRWSYRADRPIDGFDQLDFFLGHQERSNREGFVYHIKNELRAVKWRNWKMHFIWEVEPNAGPNKLETPYIFNLVRDPKEETK